MSVHKVQKVRKVPHLRYERCERCLGAKGTLWYQRTYLVRCEVRWRTFRTFLHLLRGAKGTVKGAAPHTRTVPQRCERCEMRYFSHLAHVRVRVRVRKVRSLPPLKCRRLGLQKKRGLFVPRKNKCRLCPILFTANCTLQQQNDH